MVGIASFMGSEFSPWRAVSQNEGSACRLVGSIMQDQFARHAEVLELMLLYTQSRATQVSQMAVCNRHHLIEQKLCPWLLFSLDRLAGNRLHNVLMQEAVEKLSDFQWTDKKAMRTANGFACSML
jgi:hypothetical protein